MSIGKVVQVIGPVVDIEFPLDQLPAIYNAVKIEGKVDQVEINLTVEVMQHLGDNTTRCIAMSSTDGLTRGMKATDTGAPISIPVGPETLGRVFNVLGQTVDNKPEAVKTAETWPIHRASLEILEGKRVGRCLLAHGSISATLRPNPPRGFVPYG